MPLPDARDRDAGDHQHDDQEPEVDRVGRAEQREAVAQRVDDRVLAIASSSTASRPPRKPTIIPSITNGQRMNQLVAPTSFITSTSRRRAKTDSRIVLAISAIEASTSSAASAGRERLHEAGGREDLVRVLLAVAHLVDRAVDGVRLAAGASARARTRSCRACPGPRA